MTFALLFWILTLSAAELRRLRVALGPREVT
jgi:hypothetical protein